MVEGCEGLEIVGGYIGGQNRASVYINADAVICQAIDIHDVFFDGSLLGTIICEAQADGNLSNIINIHDNKFMGQLSCPRVFVALPRAGQPVAALVNFHDNFCQGHLKTPLQIFGVREMQVHCNQVIAYNARNSGTDADFAAGAYVGQAATEIDFHHNKWGGGLNNFGAVNNCKWGIVKAGDASTATASSERALLGMAGGSVVSGISQTYPT